MKVFIDEAANYDHHGDESPEKVERYYDVTFRDSTVIWDGYSFMATSFHQAVRKARKWALKQGHTTWSVYRVYRTDLGPTSERYGPFKYSRKWGKK